jgi:mannosyltransferase OCH1-like enzyme
MAKRPLLSIFAASTLVVFGIELLHLFSLANHSFADFNVSEVVGSYSNVTVSPRCREQEPSSIAIENKLSSASALAPRELLCRPYQGQTVAIPKLFHQSWKSAELPSKFQHWSGTCRDLHPDWEWVLWTDDDNLQLVQMYFPWLEQTFLGLPGPIYRADFARNLYMYMFGGCVI